MMLLNYQATSPHILSYPILHGGGVVVMKGCSQVLVKRRSLRKGKRRIFDFKESIISSPYLRTLWGSELRELHCTTYAVNHGRRVTAVFRALI